jgi:hypothetical protein
LLLALLTLATGVRAEGSADEALAMSLKSGVGPYPTAGPIPVTLQITNESGEPQWIAPPILGWNSKVTVTDPHGAHVRYARGQVTRNPLPKHWFRELAPGDTYTMTLDLSKFFDFEASGVHRVAISWTSEDDGARHGLQAWTGVLASPSLDVRVDANPE